MAWKSLFVITFLLSIAAVFNTVWETHSYRSTSAATAKRSDGIIVSGVVAGGYAPADFRNPKTPIHEELTAADVAEGKRLFAWFNCNTCHAGGGGDIGPALMDEKWIYGEDPANIFASIVEGRPNGMPAFRTMIPEPQVWQIVAYVRSMSAKTPLYSRAGRTDHMQAKPTEGMAPDDPVVNGGNTAPDSRSSIP